MAKIISIHSFRAGTGKSNITANVAAQLALQGNRVGVIDADIPSPGIHTLFGIDEKDMGKTLNDYLWGRCDIEETAYDVSAHVGEGAVAAMGGDIYLIPSSNHAGEITRVLRDGYDVGLLNDGLRALINKLGLDYLFIDTHPGLNEETLLSIAISDLLIIVLRTDQQDFQGTAVTVDVARKLNVPYLSLVINKVPFTDLDFVEELRRQAGEEVRRQVEEISAFFEKRRRQESERQRRQIEELRRQAEQTYAIPVIAILPLSEGVARMRSADLFSLRVPDHPFSTGIRSIVAVIEATEVEAAE
jgi:MinD-like ATPase involved in chromosome partitioning or flagellar assembly